MIDVKWFIVPNSRLSLSSDFFIYFLIFLMERFFSIPRRSECQIQIPPTAGWAWSSLQPDTDVPTAAALCCWYRSSWSLSGFRARAPFIKVVKLAFLSAPEIQISPGSCFVFRPPSIEKWSRGPGGYPVVIVGWRWREVEVVSSVGGRLKSDHTMERIYHFSSPSYHQTGMIWWDWWDCQDQTVSIHTMFFFTGIL